MLRFFIRSRLVLERDLHFEMACNNNITYAVDSGGDFPVDTQFENTYNFFIGNHKYPNAASRTWQKAESTIRVLHHNHR